MSDPAATVPADWQNDPVVWSPPAKQQAAPPADWRNDPVVWKPPADAQPVAPQAAPQQQAAQQPAGNEQPAQPSDRAKSLWDLAVTPPTLSPYDPRVDQKTPYSYTEIEGHPIWNDELKRKYKKTTGKDWGPEEDRDYTELRDTLRHAYDYFTGELGTAHAASPEEREKVLWAVQKLGMEGKYGQRGFFKQAMLVPFQGLASGPEALFQRGQSVQDKDSATFARQVDDIVRKSRDGDYSWYDPRGLAVGGLKLGGELGGIAAATAAGGPAAGLTATGATFGLGAFGNTSVALRDRGVSGIWADVAGLGAGALATAAPSAIGAAGKLPLVHGLAEKVVGKVGEAAGGELGSVASGAGTMGLIGGGTAAIEEGAAGLAGKETDWSRVPKETVSGAAQGAVAGGLLGLPKLTAAGLNRLAAYKSPPSRVQFQSVTGERVSSEDFRTQKWKEAKAAVEQSPQPPPGPKTFHVEAMDEKGNEYISSVEAASQEEASAIVKENGYIPTKIKEQSNAKRIEETGPDDGGGSPQPSVRQEGGDTAESGQGLQQGGRGDGNLEGQAAQQAPQEEAQGQRADSTAAAGVEDFRPIKHEATEAGRTEHGLPERTPSEYRAEEEARATAASASPEEIDGLMDRLRENMRGSTQIEGAMLERRQGELEQQHAVATESGDAEAIKRSEEKLLDIYDINERSGSEAGRGFAFRKGLRENDFSLEANTERQLKANKGPMTDEQRATIAESTAEIKRLITELEKAQSKNAELEKAHADMVKAVGSGEPTQGAESESKKSIVSARRAAAKQKVSDAWDSFRKAALSPVVSANPLRPDMLKAAYDLAKAHIELGITTFTEFMQNVRKQMGDKEGEENRSLFAAAWKRLKEEGSTPRPKVDVSDPEAVARFAKKLHREAVELGVGDVGEAVNAVHGELSQHVPGITPEQTADAMASVKQYRPKTKNELLDTIQEHKKELRQRAKEQRGIPTPEDSAYTRSLQKRLTDYQDRVSRGDFAKKPIVRRVPDRQQEEILGKINKQKDILRDMEDKARYQNAPWYVKAADALGAARVTNLLTHFPIIGKLATSTLIRLGSQFGEDVAIGGALRKLPGTRGLMRKASEGGAVEGIANLKTQVHGVIEGLTAGIKNLPRRVKTGEEPLEMAYGDKKSGRPDHFAERHVRNLHAALHDPAKQVGFITNLEKKMDSYAAKWGEDYVRYPPNQMAIANEAYKKALGWTLLQDNMVSKLIQGWFDPSTKGKEWFDPATKQPTGAGAALQLTGRVVAPFTKVQLNILSEAFVHLAGVPSAGVRLLSHAVREARAEGMKGAFDRAIEKLTPDQADLIARHLKKGMSGAAVALLGFANPQLFGTFYYPGKESEDHTVGWWLREFVAHSPLGMAGRFGGSVRVASTSYLRKNDAEPQGFWLGALAVSMGLVDDLPGFREVYGIGKGSRDAASWLGRELESLVVPGISQDIASGLDKDASGKPIQRQPHGVVENIKMGIPGLRKTVPEKHEKKWWE